MDQTNRSITKAGNSSSRRQMVAKMKAALEHAETTGKKDGQASDLYFELASHTAT